MPRESKEVFEKYTPVQIAVKNRKLKKLESEEHEVSVETKQEDKAITPLIESRAATLPIQRRIVTPPRPLHRNRKRWSSIRMFSSTFVEGKRECTKELVDISSGQSKYSYHGFPIKGEGIEAETTKTRAPRTTLAEARVPETEMPENLRRLLKNLHVYNLW